MQARCLEEGTKGQGEEDERRGRRKSKRRDAVRDSERETVLQWDYSNRIVERQAGTASRGPRVSFPSE